MPECRHRSHRTNKHGILPHLAQNSLAQLIAPQPGRKQRLARMSRNSALPAGVHEQNSRRIGDSSASRPRTIGPRIIPPAIPKNSHQSSRASSSPSGRNASTRKSRADSMQKPRAKPPPESRQSPEFARHPRKIRSQLPISSFSRIFATQREPSKDPHHPIAAITSNKTRKIVHRPRHRPNHPQQRKRAARLRKVSCRRNPSRRWLQSADPAKVRGHTNRPSAIAPHAASRKSRRNRGRLAPARSARRPRQVPGIISPPIKKVVGLPRHQHIPEYSSRRESPRPPRATAQPAEHPPPPHIPARNRDPASQRCPATSIEDLIESGTPCNGPKASPTHHQPLPPARACASTTSGCQSTKAFKEGFKRSSRSR